MVSKKFLNQAIVTGIITLIVSLIVAYASGCFSAGANGKIQAEQQVENTNSDSSSSNTTTNKDVRIKGDQNNAGRDVNTEKTEVKGDQYNANRDVKNDNRKIEVNGPAFFDSSKQINVYSGMKARKLTKDLLQTIRDSLRNRDKEIPIAICNASGKEGETLAKEIATALSYYGYKKISFHPFNSLENRYDSIAIDARPDKVCTITIYPLSNISQ